MGLEVVSNVDGLAKYQLADFKSVRTVAIERGDVDGIGFFWFTGDDCS